MNAIRALAIAALIAVAPVLCFAEDMDRQTATGGCMLLIKKILHDPDSATFGHSSEADVLIKGNRAMVIRSVRAKNSFGALRLDEFLCLLEVNNGIITPAFVGQKGERRKEAMAIINKWKMSEPPKAATKK